MDRGQQKTAVLIPVKPFDAAKSRLASVCSQPERQSIAKAMLRNVLGASGGLRVAIVASSAAVDVRRFALINGARFLTEPDAGGVNPAVQSGVSQLAHSDYERVIVVHSDIPGVRDLSWMSQTEGIIIVPDRTGRGTNAISIPTDCGFRFSFGLGSLQRHCDEARYLGFVPQVIIDSQGLSADIDEPKDLERAAISIRPSNTWVK